MKKRHLIIVEWEDITGLSKWHSEEDAAGAKTLHCITVGWRMKTDRKHLSLASTRSEGGDCLDRTTIPRTSVRSVRRIE